MEHRLAWRTPFAALVGHTRMLLAMVALTIIVLASVWVLTLSDFSPAKAATNKPASAPDTPIENYYRPF